MMKTKPQKDLERLDKALWACIKEIDAIVANQSDAQVYNLARMAERSIEGHGKEVSAALRQRFPTTAHP